MDQHFPWYARIAGWMAVVVVGRELLVTVIRSLIEGSGGDFSAKMAGKLKMVFQCVAACSALVALALLTADSGVESLPAWLWWTMIISIWVSVGSTLHSGYLYVVAAKDILLGNE